MNFKLGSHHGTAPADDEEGTNRVRCGGWEDHYQGYGDWIGVRLRGQTHLDSLSPSLASPRLLVRPAR